jgi:hypothetical protein
VGAKRGDFFFEGAVFLLTRSFIHFYCGQMLFTGEWDDE